MEKRKRNELRRSSKPLREEPLSASERKAVARGRTEIGQRTAEKLDAGRRWMELIRESGYTLTELVGCVELYLKQQEAEAREKAEAEPARAEIPEELAALFELGDSTPTNLATIDDRDIEEAMRQPIQTSLDLGDGPRLQGISQATERRQGARKRGKAVKAAPENQMDLFGAGEGEPQNSIRIAGAG